MKPALLFYFLNFSSQNWFHACFYRQSLLPLLSLLFTHVCPATGFCRCCAFQIGKICCQNCIVRNFQFRKFLPVNSYFLPAFSPCLTVPYANPFCPGKSFLFPISSQVIFQPSSHCPYFLSPLFIFFISQIIKSYSNPSGNVL